VKTDLAAMVESILLAPYGGVKPKPCVLLRCPHCGGSGYAPYHHRGSEREEWCTHCKGGGKILTEGGEL
jgi:hypothetical protein